MAGNDESGEECRKMLDAVNAKLIPNRIVIYVNNSKKGNLQKHVWLDVLLF